MNFRRHFSTEFPPRMQVQYGKNQTQTGYDTDTEERTAGIL